MSQQPQAKSPINVVAEFRGLLTKDARLNNVPIYPVIAPKGTKSDFIVFRRGDPKPEQSLMGGVEIGIQIMVVTTDYDKGLQLADSIYHILEEASPRVRLFTMEESFAGDNYIQELEFRYNYF